MDLTSKAYNQIQVAAVSIIQVTCWKLQIQSSVPCCRQSDGFFYVNPTCKFVFIKNRSWYLSFFLIGTRHYWLTDTKCPGLQASMQKGLISQHFLIFSVKNFLERLDVSQLQAVQISSSNLSGGGGEIGNHARCPSPLQIPISIRN